jgi:hypothetical protein
MVIRVSVGCNQVYRRRVMHYSACGYKGVIRFNG